MEQNVKLINATPYENRLENYRRHCELKGDQATAEVVADCIAELRACPVEEVAPVVNAYWVWCKSLDIMPVQNRLICSNCGTECPTFNNYYLPYTAHGGSRYCHNCGAKMDLHIHDETED